MFLELHLIQSFGPSVLNRDDTNMPKSAVYGGVPRARVSSQCLKRLMREHYEAVLGDQARSVISREVPARIGKMLAGLTGRPLDEATSVAATALRLAAFDVSTVKPGAYQMAAPSRFAVSDLAATAEAILPEYDRVLEVFTAATAAAKPKKDPLDDIIAEKSDLAKRVSGFALRESNLGVVLFGRMITMTRAVRGTSDDETGETEKTSRTDGATAVAHAISTHRSSPDFDFFTALDDLADTSGGAMMGSIPFNSAAYYRAVVVDLRELAEGLGRSQAIAFPDALRAVIDATVRLAPRAKQATFFANEAPSLVLAVVRDTAPLSLANAFERPVTPAAAGGYIEPSVTALASHWTQQRAAWGDAGIRGTLVFSPLDEAVLGGLAAHAVRPYDAFIEAVVTLATGEA